MVILVDELALPSRHRASSRPRGATAGHNGLQDIQAVLGRHQNYARLRFGIGQHFPKGHQVDFVLGRWQATEMEFVTPGIERAIKLLETWVLAGAQTAMNQYNQ